MTYRTRAGGVATGALLELALLATLATLAHEYVA